MPNALGLLADPRGEMRATPRNKLMGLLADALQGAQDYAQRPDPRMPGGKANPVLGLLADAASLQSLATTAQRASYGEPLTNKGKANVPFLRPETADVAMMAPLSPRNALAALGMMGGGVGGMERAVYLAHTPLKPNPSVGTRFEREFIGGLADKAPRKIEDMQGANILAMPWDSTSRNYRIKSVSDEVLPSSVLTTGGQDFARDLENIANNVGGASNFGIAQRIQERVRLAAKENHAKGGDGTVYSLPTTMGDWGENFSTMPTELFLNLIQRGDLAPSQANRINELVRTAPMIKDGKTIRPFGGFRGVDTHEGLQQFLTGEGIDTTAGELRKAFAARMRMAEMQKSLGYNIEDVTAALTDPALAGVPKGFAGNTVIRSDPHGPLTMSDHPSYDTHFPGQYFGSLLGNIPVEHLMPKTYRQLSAELASRGGDLRTNVIGAMEKRKSGISELVDQEVIDSVNRYLSQSRSAR